MGEEAVEAFTTLTTDPFFSQVPAVRLVPEKQPELAEKPLVDERRRSPRRRPTPVRSATSSAT